MRGGRRKPLYYEVRAKGVVYRYAWRGRGAPRLLEQPGTPAFATELASALETRHAGDASRIDGLCTAYLSSSEWDKLAPKTKANWRIWIDRIRGHFGELRIGMFDRPDIRRDIRDWRDRYSSTPRAADMGLQVLSRLLAHAAADGMLKTNPVAGMARLYEGNRSSIIWTAEDLARLEQHASPEIMRAARLAALTGLRQSDLLRLEWSHITDLSIEIATGKSRGRKTAVVPMYGELRALLATFPRIGKTVLTTQRGKPWSGGFTASWNKAVKRAGIDKHFHDLRGTAATRLYLSGLTIREIAEIMTWAEAAVENLINRYVKRDELLRARIRTLDKAV